MTRAIPINRRGDALYLAKWMAQHLVKERTGPLRISTEAPLPPLPERGAYQDRDLMHLRVD